MSKLQDALDQIKDPTVADAKAQFEQLINEGKAASDAFIKSSAEQLEQWTIDVSNGKMSQDEFDNLVSSQAILAKNFVVSQALAAQERAEKADDQNGRARCDEDHPAAVACYLSLSSRRCKKASTNGCPDFKNASLNL